MSDTPIIWDCDFLRSSAYDAPIGYPFDRKKDPEFTTVFGNAMLKLRRGKPVERDELPAHLFVSERYMKFPKAGLADFCRALNLWVVSERVKALFEQFDIGETRFHELPILSLDGKTPLEGRWFVFAPASEKSCFVPELTHKNRAGGSPKAGYNAGGDYRHDLFVRAAAAAGADMWTDPILRGALFFSDRMKRAIEAAGFRGSIRFFRCAVVQVH